MRNVTFAATQFSCSWDLDRNLAAAEQAVRAAADRGAEVILLQELFETPYFCAVEKAEYLELARPLAGHATVERFQRLAAELGVVVPVSFYERAGSVHYNAVAVIDADGRIVGHYRKTHIPQAPGYEEKFYFSPGDTPFEPIPTRFGALGIGICWDQWFPETARALVLRGAEFLLFPTAIGSEPSSPDYDSREHWQMTMRGHAAANIVPVIASNRIGTETTDGVAMTFYGSSFIAGPTGALVAEADRHTESVITATIDLDHAGALRRGWGTFRDRRPERYGALLTLDGRTRAD